MGLDVWSMDFWTRCFLPMLRVKPNRALVTPCMEWVGLRDSGGHGVMLLPDDEDSSVMGAHRYAFTMVYGDPGDLYVLHKCHNAACCNVLHLYPGTQQQNMRDKLEHGSLRGTLAKAREPFAKDYIHNRYRDRQSRIDIWTKPIDMDQSGSMDLRLLTMKTKQSQGESTTH